MDSLADFFENAKGLYKSVIAANSEIVRKKQGKFLLIDVPSRNCAFADSPEETPRFTAYFSIQSQYIYACRIETPRKPSELREEE